MEIILIYMAVIGIGGYFAKKYFFGDKPESKQPEEEKRLICRRYGPAWQDGRPNRYHDYHQDI